MEWCLSFNSTAISRRLTEDGDTSTQPMRPIKPEAGHVMELPSMPLRRSMTGRFQSTNIIAARAMEGDIT
jgi:hypothetical protein